MKKIDLNQSWKMKIASEDTYYNATVPGSVYNDLLAAGKMDDPYYRDNEGKALELMKNDFEYRGTFDVDCKEADGTDEVLLVFSGIDTLADISLNGTELGSVNNMHRVWEYPVRSILKEKDNEIVVKLHSPVNFIAKEFEADPAILGTEDAMRGFPKIRKGHYMFGWDWGPRLPDAGIWKSVGLFKVNGARLTRSYIGQKWNEDYSRVEISISAMIETMEDGALSKERALNSVKNESFALRADIISPEGVILAEKADLTKPFAIENPELWWPNGLGNQPLYTVNIELVEKESDKAVDSCSKRIGLRKLDISREKDEFGEEFAQTVNGIKYFAMGADYIPEDNILSRTCAERTRKLLTDCVAANFNSIRVWGGGLYPDDYFFDICDELGLVVWQDFMFACANYRLTREFEDNIMEELKCQIRRLSHHASLGLWCGNNEMEMFVGQGTWGAKNEIKSDYVKMYEYLFPRLMETEDPDRVYWPASPSSGGGFDYPNDPDRGDVHYWDVWHGNKPFTEYRKFFFRYLSEFGFQSFPSIKTVETFTLPKDRNVFSYVMEKHQRNAAANGKIMNYMEQTFLYPNSLDILIYASQLLQAEAIRYGVEHFRRNRGRCMGTVYWQLNDCWPVASWASIDYYGRWKALHYYAKRFFAPLLVSCEEEGLLSQSMNVNEEPFEVKKSIRLSVTNDSISDRKVTVKWQLRNFKGEIKKEEKKDIKVPALSAVWLDKTDLKDAVLYEDYVSYSLEEDGKTVSEGTVLFCPPKHFSFVDPELKARVEGNEIVVSSKYYAKSIEIRNANDDLILSDNFFDLNGGEKRVKIVKGNADTISVRSVWDIR